MKNQGDGLMGFYWAQEQKLKGPENHKERRVNRHASPRDLVVEETLREKVRKIKIKI